MNKNAPITLQDNQPFALTHVASCPAGITDRALRNHRYHHSSLQRFRQLQTSLLQFWKNKDRHEDTPETFNSPSALYQHDLEKDERQIAEWYNTLSDSYDELYGKEQSQKHETVLEFLGNRHLRVLVDIGCGTGAFLERANRTYDYAIGIDLSTKMLQISRGRKTRNTDYVLASSSSLPLKNNSADCSVSISTAKAESNLPTIISELERISHQDSLLAVSVFQTPGTLIPSPFATRARPMIISDRETLYFLSPHEISK